MVTLVSAITSRYEAIIANPRRRKASVVERFRRLLAKASDAEQEGHWAMLAAIDEGGEKFAELMGE